MSSDRGGSGSHHRPPAHQNTFAWRHNPNSRKTKVILALPNTGLCQRCFDVIEWKKKYRKYKPLDRARRCTGCGELGIKLAYHVVCQPCSAARGVCAKCLEPHALVETEDAAAAELRQQIELLETHKGGIPGVPERERRALLRQLLRGTGAGAADGGAAAGGGADGGVEGAHCDECRGAAASSAGAADDDGSDNDEEDGSDGAPAGGGGGGRAAAAPGGDGGAATASAGARGRCACTCHRAAAAVDGDCGGGGDEDGGDSDGDEDGGDDDEGDDSAPAILREALRRSRARRAAAEASATGRAGAGT